MLLPGETIDVSNTFVLASNFSSIFSNPIPLFYPVALPSAELIFSSSNFDGTFNFTASQGETDSTPAHTIQFTGQISILPSGRLIDINIQSQYTFASDNYSNTDTCTTYIPPVPPSTNNRKWKLTNDNLTTSIQWQALLADGSTIIGGTLTPGSFVGSTFYGGTYTCIRNGSLTYGAGGSVIDGVC